MIQKFLILTTLNYLIKQAIGSVGDNSEIFIDCVGKCWINNCTTRSKLENVDWQDEDLKLDSSHFKTNHELHQPLHLKLLGWDCESECRYNCMWETVELFENLDVDIPQFYGKWPFVRILGIQEPVSTIASIFNLIANYKMIKKMKHRIPRYSPFKSLWYFFGFICLNTWFWSTIFHTRDTPFTECMDYFSAFALILVQFNAFFIRYLKLNRNKSSTLLMYSINLLSILYFMYHTYYLYFIKFDYGYNMQMNIIVGLLNSICWITWSYDNYINKKNFYVWQCAFSVLLFDILMVFEVFDFSPILWSFDSHALWHLSTIIIPYYWYNFIIDDNLYIDGNYHRLL